MFPIHVKRINNALLKTDRLQHANGSLTKDWMVPIMADAEAGFGGILNAYDLMTRMIENGASAVHYEDQLSSVKKCGHMGGKVLVPSDEFVEKLSSVRLATDVAGVDTIVVGRTDADAATLVTNDISVVDRKFIKNTKKTKNGFFEVECGVEAAIARGLAYAPYVDVLWMETSRPNVEQAKRFAERIHEQYPGKILTYNCSPSFNWKEHLTESQIESFQEELSEFGYKFFFVTLSGFHSLNYAMFELARDYKEHGMAAYSRLQRKEFAAEEHGYRATKHQSFVSAGLYDKITQTIQKDSTLTALEGSTEEEQFNE